MPPLLFAEISAMSTRLQITSQGGYVIMSGTLILAELSPSDAAKLSAAQLAIVHGVINTTPQPSTIINNANDAPQS